MDTLKMSQNTQRKNQIMEFLPSILAFLCGSLVATAVFTVFVWRRERHDAQLIRHVKVQSYNAGWQDAANDKYKA